MEKKVKVEGSGLKNIKQLIGLDTPSSVTVCTAMHVLTDRGTGSGEIMSAAVSVFSCHNDTVSAGV